MKLSHQKLAAAPELAALAVLDTSLDVTMLALAAACPELASRHVIDDQSRAALDLLALARDLALAVKRYRRTLVPKPRPDDDWPF